MTTNRPPGRPTTRDDNTRTPEYQALLSRLQNITAPCTGGTEWTSDNPRHQNRAATLCRPCQALPQCRAYALTTGQAAGVWGGLTPDELRATIHARQNHPANQPHPIQARNNYPTPDPDKITTPTPSDLAALTVTPADIRAHTPTPADRAATIPTQTDIAALTTTRPTPAAPSSPANPPTPGTRQPPAAGADSTRHRRTLEQHHNGSDTAAVQAATEPQRRTARQQAERRTTRNTLKSADSVSQRFNY